MQWCGHPDAPPNEILRLSSRPLNEFLRHCSSNAIVAIVCFFSGMSGPHLRWHPTRQLLSVADALDTPGLRGGWVVQGHFSVSLGRVDPRPQGWGFPGCWGCWGPRIGKGGQGKKHKRDATKPSACGGHGTVLSGNEASTVEMGGSASSSDPHSE